MREIKLTAGFFEGVVSVEWGDGWIQPWRLPVERRELFPSPGDALFLCAGMASGVRLRLRFLRHRGAGV